jgi:hypothetical protein
MRHGAKRKPNHLLSLIVVIAVLGLGVAACGSMHEPHVSTPSAGVGNKPALCMFVSDIDSAANTATSPSQDLAVLRSFQPRFAQALNDAPSEVRSEVKTLVDASRSAIDTGNPSVASTDAVVNAGYQLDVYCGIRKSGS